jgi:hypothetical protein
MEALDRFGQIVAIARDQGIEWFDGYTRSPTPVPDYAAPEAQAIDRDLNTFADLPPPIREFIRRIVVLSVNATVHDLLERFSDECRQSTGAILVDGVDLFHAAWDDRYWPGLQGGLYGDDGWYSRFSRYGEYGNETVERFEHPPERSDG